MSCAGVMAVGGIAYAALVADVSALVVGSGQVF